MNLYWRMLLLRLRWLRARRLSIWDTARTPFRVVPTDLDLLLHMNNGKYLTLMDLGRMDLMVRSGMWAKLSARGWFPVVAGQTITYRKSLRLGQRDRGEGTPRGGPRRMAQGRITLHDSLECRHGVGCLTVAEQRLRQRGRRGELHRQEFLSGQA